MKVPSIEEAQPGRRLDAREPAALPASTLSAEARSRTPRGNSRRQAIIEIARNAFLAEGYAATSMSTIGQRVGGSKATLYIYFPSKADLFAAVMADMCAKSRLELTAEAHAAAAGVVEVLTRVGRRYVRLMLSDELITLHRLVVAECVRFPELGEALYAVGPRLGNAALAEALAHHALGGALHVSNTARAAGQFFDLCVSGLYRRRLWNVAEPISEREMDKNVDAAVQVFIAAYGAMK